MNRGISIKTKQMEIPFFWYDLPERIVYDLAVVVGNQFAVVVGDFRSRLFHLYCGLYQKKQTRHGYAFLFFFWLLFVLFVSGVPTVDFHLWESRINLVSMECAAHSVWNFLLFLPIGFFPPFLWNGFTKWRNVIYLGAGLSLCIEIVQIFTFWNSDLVDFIAGVAGTVAGFLLAGLSVHLWNIDLPKKRRSSADVKELVLFAASIFAIMVLWPLCSHFFWSLAIRFLY